MSVVHHCSACKKTKVPSLTYCQNCGDWAYCPDCKTQHLFRERRSHNLFCSLCFPDIATRNTPDSYTFSWEDAEIDVFH